MPLRIYLMQHGDAVEKDVNRDRPLSERGQRDVDRVGALMARSGIRIARILHSVKVRAKQSAELLARHVGGTIIETKGLRPDDSIDDTIELIEGANADTAIVGHLPHLAQLCARLLRTKGESAPVAFQRGGVVALERDNDGAWQIVWMVVPEIAAE